MKAVVYTNPGTVKVQEIPIPETLPDEIKVKIEYCALCATDVHLVYNGLFQVKPPLILGHEMSGSIVEIGSKAALETNFKIGDHVTANPVRHCGECVYCRKGQPSHCIHAAFDQNKKPMDCMAEYRTFLPSQLYKLPDGVSLLHGCLTEPLTTVSRGIELSGISFGSTVCVSGAGSIGLIMLDALKYCGAAKLTVIDPIPEKRTLALEMGAEHAIDPTSEDVIAEAMRITNGIGFDYVFEMSGVPSAGEICGDLVANLGCIEFFAVYPEDYTLPLNLFKLFNKEARIQFTFTNPYLYPKSIDLLKRLDMDKIIGPVYDIEDAPQAFEDFKKAKHPKLLIKCSR